MMKSLLRTFGCLLTRPLAWILQLRHFLYDKGILPSTAFDFPVIDVGNVQLGGTGKTPMTEYLVKHLLEQGKRVGVVSRGYKRSTTGFILADQNVTVRQIGDEPYQLYRKFQHHPAFSLAVGENRPDAIRRLKEQTGAEVIVLDDAFQHRRLRAGLDILLTPFHRPFDEDCLFPAGRLRDVKSRAADANMIVVTKTPPEKQDEKKALQKRLEKYVPAVWFAGLSYASPRRFDKTLKWEDLLTSKVLLITGIADPAPLHSFIKRKNINFVSLTFPDHVRYGRKERDKIRRAVEQYRPDVVLTTEKDFYKLHGQIPQELYYVPVEVKMENENEFLKNIMRYVNT